jgi:hypothetical protein
VVEGTHGFDELQVAGTPEGEPGGDNVASAPSASFDISGGDERMAALFERVRGDDADAVVGSGHDDGVPFGAPPATSLTTTHRGRAWLLVGAAVVIFAGAGAAAYELSGYNGSDTGSALSAAVTTSLHSRSADIALSMTIGASGQGLTIAGIGDTSFATSATNLTLTYSAGGQPLTERAVIDGSTAYYDLGPVVGDVVPGKTWVSIDTGKDVSGTSGVGAGGIFSDPTAMLSVLQAEGTAVHALGSSSIDGVPVQGYSIRLGPAGIAKTIASEHVPAYMRTEVASVHYSRLSYDVYVDSASHLKQIRTTGAFSVAGQGATITSTMEFSNYGTPVSAQPPPASQVVPIQQFDQVAKQDTGTSTA